jgi:hypothetical protein
MTNSEIQDIATAISLEMGQAFIAGDFDRWDILKVELVATFSRMSAFFPDER